MYRKIATNFLRKHTLLRMIAWFFYNTLVGLHVYFNIIRKYGRDYRIYVEHYPGTGDVYITCGYLKSFAITEGNPERYVLTVIGNGAMKMAELFEIKNIIKLTQHQSNSLIHLGRLVGFDELGICVLHYHPMAMHNGIIDNLMSYKDINFFDMYMFCVFPNLKLGDFRYPNIVKDSIYVDTFCEVNNLLNNKIILLCPYANTIDPLSWKFWCILSEIFISKGYKVCTNASENEDIIPNTTRVFLSYKYMPDFIGRCDSCIGLRSGLFDFIANTETNLIVLYPKTNYYKFGVGSLYDYFSLKKMGLNSNAFEIEFYRNEEVRLLQKILEYCTKSTIELDDIMLKYNSDKF